jgi:hypothetical protein
MKGYARRRRIAREGFGNSDMVSGALALPMPLKGGKPHERDDETNEMESQRGLQDAACLGAPPSIVSYG